MANRTFEVNFDGLIGPTHNYAGLSPGNLASTTHKAQVSHPKEAALQGLRKMKALHDLGLVQAVLPPHPRPHLGFLRQIGFEGDAETAIEKAARTAPELFLASCSASAMWTANAATVVPSTDSQDGTLHLSPANLSAKFHRSLEPGFTHTLLKAIFADGAHFTVHEALPPGEFFADEGAANHTRLAEQHGKPGIHFFVYGRKAFAPNHARPALFSARQTLEASQAIARRHGLSPERTVFAQQNPVAIDAGVFHNDVACVGNENILFFHEEAFLDKAAILAALQKAFTKVSGQRLLLIEVPAKEVSLQDAVESYLFNSQLVTLPDQTRVLLAPRESEGHPRVKAYLDRTVGGSNPLQKVQFFDLRQSMNNGGGPACLRLRVPMQEAQLKALKGNVVLTDSLYQELTQWVEQYYADSLTADLLIDPQTWRHNTEALRVLYQLLKLSPCLTA